MNQSDQTADVQTQSGGVDEPAANSGSVDTPPETQPAPPATTDEPDPNATRRVAVVLEQDRMVTVGQHTYRARQGDVIRVLDLPVDQRQAFTDGFDTKIVDAGNLEVGQNVSVEAPAEVETQEEAEHAG